TLSRPVFHFVVCSPPAPAGIYTLSLHDALPILVQKNGHQAVTSHSVVDALRLFDEQPFDAVLSDVKMGALGGFDLLRQVKERARSEEHTSELQSLRHLVCRLLLEKKNIYPNPLP